MWISAAIATDAGHAEALSEALFGRGAISVSIEDACAGTEAETPRFGEPTDPAAELWECNRVVALFEPDSDLAQRIAAALIEAGIDETPNIEFTDVAEEDWVRLSQAQFEPIRINHRLWIVPSWHAVPDPTAINLALDPGMAFGTGSHPTTRLCLDWLCAELRGGESVLDYGCGSGILGLAAAKLGAGLTVGVDIDPHALVAARDNAQRNNAVLTLRSTDEPIPERFDRVVANILTNTLCVLAPTLVGRLAPGGRIALSGILESQAGQVIAAFAPFLQLREGAVQEGWVRLDGELSC